MFLFIFFKSGCSKDKAVVLLKTCLIVLMELKHCNLQALYAMYAGTEVPFWITAATQETEQLSRYH